MAGQAFGHMLENPSIPHYQPKGGDNVLGADNQQERLIELGWVLGFVDGEGCFSIGFLRQPDRKGRKGYKTGYQVFHEFAVTQGAKSISCLHAIREFFGVGQVYANKRYDNHKEHLYRFVVRPRSELLEVVIPFFRRHPLRTSKQHDFEKFARCIELVERGRHLTRDGLLEIVEIAQTMNSQKPRPELVRILRDHTPNSETSDDDMVPTAWRHAGAAGERGPLDAQIE
jgi:LAGLIDADG endonuclease